MEKERSQQAYVNRTAIILFTVLTSIISVAYIVQFIKGEAGWGLFLPIEIFDLVPMILCWVVYRMNSDSQLIKHIIAVGYGLFYRQTRYSSLFTHCRQLSWSRCSMITSCL